ncbi:hypothetical protein STTU_5986 [Streptomyces sp. Tu6071]|nr:hypothetical protein STTU_5986 [Streptomyces sp. Tu6071]
MLTEAAVTRYLTPLREGGSLPGLVEAADGELYVLKFSGAGQGRKTLVAETVCGLLAARLGLRVPALRALDLDPVIGLGEPDEQVQGLLKGSGGLNLGMGYLAGALGFDPLAYAVEPHEAGRVLWFDALVGNVDRSWRNPNLLVQVGELWLIDHGATMIWQHNWPTAAASALRRYDARDHVLAPFAPDLASAEAELAPLVTEDLLTGILAEVPGAWLEGERGFASADEVRRAYVDALLRRADGLSARIDLPEEPPAPPVPASGWRRPGEGAPAPVPPAPGTGTPQVFEYAALRLVPRVDRGEYVNAGVVVYQRATGFVAARTRLDPARLRGLDPDADAEGAAALLRAVEAVCGGGSGAGGAAGDDAGRRFRWLVAPRSALLQPGPVHTGLTRAPGAELDRLLERLVP